MRRPSSGAKKPCETFPDDLDIVVSDTNVAMAMKDNAKTVDFAVKGAAVYHSILQQPKPADVSDAEWNNRITQQQLAAKPDYEFLENAAFNAIVAEQDPNQRMNLHRAVHAGFPQVTVRSASGTNCDVQLAADQSAAALAGLRRKGVGCQS